MHMMSFYGLPRGMRKGLIFFPGKDLWQEDLGNRKYHWVNRDTICLPTDLGGLGVLNLKLMNMSLLVNGCRSLKLLMAFGRIH